ncbi:MAG TPA: winged helix-turn-helix domain-containing protein [Vicinamibacterales bacterium]|nr:winged helix-turn-helix domain-containing protein [Vicinamibacterales bacterium]
MHTRLGPSSVRFGQFELDRVAGELYCDGRRVRLQEQPRQILIALLERRGEVVTREELRERLWKSDTFVDFEHGLNTAVKKVRQALGDSAESPRFIETLAKRGYRFIGDVQSLEPAGLAADSPPVPTSVVPNLTVRRWVGRRAFWVATAIVLASAAFAIWSFSDRSNSLAVMPLRVLTASGTDSDYLGVGIADTITTRLANTREIALRPTSAVMPYKDAQSDPAHIAKSLGVRHLLLGTIQATPDSYRIGLQLVQSDGVVIWGHTFNEPATGLLPLQDRIADEVVAALRLGLSTPQRQRLHAQYTANPIAYDKYLRGRALMLNYTEAKMLEAIGHFEDAVRIDPSFALARTGIATACAWFSVRYSHDKEALVWARRADTEARAALAQDDSLADAQLAIASAAGTSYGGFNWSIVLDRTAAALALNPSTSLAHVARMRAFYHLGLFDLAREEGRLEQQLDPTPNVELSRIDIAADLFTGRYQPAIEKAKALLARTDAPAVRHYLGLALYYAGDGKSAREMLGSIMRGETPDARAQASLASVEAALGMEKEARGRISAIEHGPDMDHHIAYSVGAAMAQLHDTSASLTWLERAADTGFPCYPWFEKDPMLDPIRSDPEFNRLLDRLRVAHREAATRAN